MPTGFMPPTCAPATSSEGVRLILRGQWTSEYAPQLESFIASLETTLSGPHILFDLSDLERLDTLGAWLLNRICFEQEQKGFKTAYVGASPEHGLLLTEVA